MRGAAFCSHRRKKDEAKHFILATQKPKCVLHICWPSERFLAVLHVSSARWRGADLFDVTTHRLMLLLRLHKKHSRVFAGSSMCCVRGQVKRKSTGDPPRTTWRISIEYHK